jgi:hypothetical protein
MLPASERQGQEGPLGQQDERRWQQFVYTEDMRLQGVLRWVILEMEREEGEQYQLQRQLLDFGPLDINEPPPGLINQEDIKQEEEAIKIIQQHQQDAQRSLEELRQYQLRLVPPQTELRQQIVQLQLLQLQVSQELYHLVELKRTHLQQLQQLHQRQVSTDHELELRVHSEVLQLQQEDVQKQDTQIRRLQELQRSQLDLR